MGPVPWTVNAEIYPQSCRGMGMATSTSVNWVSNYVVSLTFLSLLEALGGAGGFMFYAGFGVLGFIAIYLLLPETKGKLRFHSLFTDYCRRDTTGENGCFIKPGMDSEQGKHRRRRIHSSKYCRLIKTLFPLSPFCQVSQAVKVPHQLQVVYEL